LLTSIDRASQDGRFEGTLRAVAVDAGLNSARSAEAIKLLEELGRIEVVQRGRRDRKTIIAVRSNSPVTLQDAESMLPSRAGKRSSRLDYNDLGHAVVDRLLELGRHDALRSAQVDVFASENQNAQKRVEELEAELEEASDRETDLRIKLKSAEEALERAEENLRKAFGGPQRSAPSQSAAPVEDEDARAVLDILRSGS
jgi:chromosome segregation ATPase